MREEKMSFFYDISDVLKPYNGKYYTDVVHLTGEGNSIVAEKIVSIIVKDYELQSSE